jgi:transposase
VPDSEFIGRLGVWEGYQVVEVARYEAGIKGPRPQAWIRLEPLESCQMLCDGCGQMADRVHDLDERHVRDLPVFDAETHLHVVRRRVACPRCGPKLERLPWLDRYSRMTRRLAETVVRLCEVMSIKHVAESYALGWDAVKDVHKSALERRLDPPDFGDVTRLAMDEFAIQKGHRYATVIIEPTRRRVLWVGRGRERASVRPFFELLGPKLCAKIEAVAMDMTAAYELEVRLHCPKAEIVFDLFHVVAKYGREVIDRARVDEANRVRSDKRARKLVKGSRWLLLRNRENLHREEDRVRLRELLDINKALFKVYVMRDDLKHLWDYRSPGHALRFWKSWYWRATHSRVPALCLFAKRLKGYVHGIVAHARYPMHTSVLEGINNRIKVIKRMAYGFRDDAYFFLRIRAAFPGKAG